MMSSLCVRNFDSAPSSMPKLQQIIHFPQVNALVPGLNLLEYIFNLERAFQRIFCVVFLFVCSVNLASKGTRFTSTQACCLRALMCKQLVVQKNESYRQEISTGSFPQVFMAYFLHPCPSPISQKHNTLCLPHQNFP